MKLKTGALFAIFFSCMFIGVIIISIGFGAIFPSLNRVARPFICPRGEMELETQTYRPYPGQTVTNLTWYCADHETGGRTELGFLPMVLCAGLIYGLLLFVATILGWPIYLSLSQRWAPYFETAEGKKRAQWIQYGLTGLFVFGMLWIGFMPWPTPEGTTPPQSTQTRVVDATATSIALTYDALRSGQPVPFTSTEKPLANWNDIPIMPQATAGQAKNEDRYSFRVVVDSGTIESFYREELKSLGWELTRSQWLGLQFTKDGHTLLVASAPHTDLQSWVVTLVLIP